MLPLEVPRDNDFTNATLDTINTFIRSHEDKLQAAGFANTALWLVIDQEALDSLTSILVIQEFNEE